MGDAAATLQKDPLTGLATYDQFLAAFSECLSNCTEKQSSLSLGLIDIDWFGKVNGKNGEEVGDLLLQKLASFVAEKLTSDGRLYRYGGDAFMVLFESLNKEDAFLVMEGIRKEVEGPHAVRVGGKRLEVPLTISCGVAAYPDDGVSARELMRKSNEALYRAKVRGRNTVALAREEKMVTKTTHYTQGQLEGLSRLAKREKMNEAALLREALDDLLRKHNS